MKKLCSRLALGWKGLLRKFRQPRWRHGRLGMLLLASFIAVCVLVNIGVQSLENEYGWRRDLSFNAYASTGEETAEILSRLEFPVELYLLYQNGEADSQLLEILNRYGILSDFITVKPTDIAKNPGILSRFQGDNDSELAAGSIIVNCEAQGRYRVLSLFDFVSQSYNMEQGNFEWTGMAYEKKLTEAIVYVAQQEIPVIGVLQGHGELSMGMLENLTSFWLSNNYDSREVNLLAGDTLDDVDLLLMAGLQKDLNDGELQAINEFALGGGSLFVMRNYTDPGQLPNYFSLLNNYGVKPLQGVVIAGEEDAGSYFGERIFLVPAMCELDMTLPLISSKMDALLLAGACAFETPPEAGEGDPSLTTATVLKTGKNAFIRDSFDENTSIERRETDATGEWSLALYGHRMHSTGNISRMFAIGNSSLFTDEYMYQSTFNEEFITQVMSELLPQKSSSLDIMASTAFHPGLTAGSQTLGIALMVAVPMLVLVAALCVLLPRKNR